MIYHNGSLIPNQLNHSLKLAPVTSNVDVILVSLVHSITVRYVRLLLV